MGLALGIGKGYQFRRRVVSTEGGKYIRAVIADGGSIESSTCVSNTFTVLNSILINQITPTNSYNTLVSNDGGSLESFFCVRNSFIELNNVAV